MNHGANIQYDERHDVDIEQLARLRASTGWTDVSHDVLTKQVHGAMWVVSAWDGPRLVGFARAISDGVTNAYIATVVVDPEYRRRGIGSTIIQRLVSGRDEVRWVLRAEPGVAAFYTKLGFEPAHDMLRRDRQGHQG